MFKAPGNSKGAQGDRKGLIYIGWKLEENIHRKKEERNHTLNFRCHAAGN